MRLRATLPALLVVVSVAAGCGASSSSRSPPGQFARQTIEWAYLGQYSKVYANLYPAQRAAVSSAAYASCLRTVGRAASAFGYLPASARFVDLSVADKTKRLAVPGTHKIVQATVVQGQLTLLRQGKRVKYGGKQKIDLARIDRRWYYIDPVCLISPKEVLQSELLRNVPGWARKEGFRDNAVAVAGAKLFAESGCLNCHTYEGSGGKNLGAPGLTAAGAKDRGVAFQVAHLKCPACVVPGSQMPAFGGLGTANLGKLAIFLEASKGG